MLKEIHHVDCSPALAACQRLMQTFALWLCDPSTTTVTRTSLRAKMPSQIEANWLWDFLKRKEDERPLMARATAIAGLSPSDKALLQGWVVSVADLSGQFAAPALSWPEKPPTLANRAWPSFKTLMQCFYSKGLRDGLPYHPDGTPVVSGGVTYAGFIAAFREKHRLSYTPDAREVCVLCGGRLGSTPEVDHWIGKSPYPLLSVCADNLLPICGDCNSTSNKGTKPVHTNGSFDAWFHPYHRPGAGKLQPTLAQDSLAIRCTAIDPADQERVQNLDDLLHLSQRWTREYKEEHGKHRDYLRREERKRLDAGSPRQTLDEVTAYIDDWRGKLLASQPDFEVHTVLGEALTESNRLAALHAELGDVN